MKITIDQPTAIADRDEKYEAHFLRRLPPVIDVKKSEVEDLREIVHIRVTDDKTGKVAHVHIDVGTIGNRIYGAMTCSGNVRDRRCKRMATPRDPALQHRLNMV